MKSVTLVTSPTSLEPRLLMRRAPRSSYSRLVAGTQPSRSRCRYAGPRSFVGNAMASQGNWRHLTSWRWTTSIVLLLFTTLLEEWLVLSPYMWLLSSHIEHLYEVIMIIYCIYLADHLPYNQNSSRLFLGACFGHDIIVVNLPNSQIEGTAFDSAWGAYVLGVHQACYPARVGKSELALAAGWRSWWLASTGLICGTANRSYVDLFTLISVERSLGLVLYWVNC